MHADYGKLGLLLIALSGLVLSTLAPSLAESALCTNEGPLSCNVVLASRYSRIAGISLHLVGSLAFALAGLLALPKSSLVREWLALLTLGGAAFGVYLLVLEAGVLRAFCPVCIATWLLWGGLFWLSWSRLGHPAGADLARRLLGWPGVLALLALTGIVWLHLAGPAPEGQESFASCLGESGARLYGAWWCPHCAEQKELFGDAASSLPYIECSEQGNPRAQLGVCRDVGISAYPTWVLPDGSRRTGPLSLPELAAATGCSLPGTS